MDILSIKFDFQKGGPFCGSHSLIMNIGGCNLRCSGYGQEYQNSKGKIVQGCPYYMNVDKHTFQNNWKNVKTLSKIKRVIKSLSPPKTKYDFIITGGEPLLYWNTAFFQSLIEGAIQSGHRVIIETNASRDISFEFAYQSDIVFSQSLKIFSSGEMRAKAINMRTLKSIKRNAKNKFYRILSSELTWREDFIDIEDILFRTLKVFPHDIWLTPIPGNNNEDFKKNRLFLRSKALQYGFNFDDSIK